MYSKMREKTTEANEEVEKIGQEITNEKDKSYQRHAQLENLPHTAHSTLAVPTGLNIARSR